jgi:hypothetical protein
MSGSPATRAVIRRLLGAATVATVVAATAGSWVAAPASATGAPVSTGAIAYSSPAHLGGEALAPSLTITGALGGLLNGIISPIVTSDLDPLLGDLQGGANTLVNSLLGSASSFNANTPTYQGTFEPAGFPADAAPPSCVVTDPTTPCYSGTGVTLTTSPLASIGVPVLSGYTQQVLASTDAANPVYARATVTNPTVSALGISLVSATAVNSKASCPTATSTAPTASVSASTVSLLGGAAGLSLASNGTIAGVTIGGNAYTLSTLPTSTFTLAGQQVTAQAYGTELRLNITLSLPSLLSGLGIAASSSVATALLGYVVSTSLTLSLVVGPSSSVTTGAATAWGLGIGVDLAGSVGFNLLGVAGATITLPTGIGGSNYGNVLDLKLAYSSCSYAGSGSTGGTPYVPPALD